MHRCVVLLGASSLSAEMNVLAPMAAHQTFFFANHATIRAGFEHVSYNMTGNPAPGLENLIFLPNLFQLALRDHGSLPVVLDKCEQS